MESKDAQIAEFEQLISKLRAEAAEKDSQISKMRIEVRTSSAAKSTAEVPKAPLLTRRHQLTFRDESESV